MMRWTATAPASLEKYKNIGKQLTVVLILQGSWNTQILSLKSSSFILLIDNWSEDFSKFCNPSASIMDKGTRTRRSALMKQPRRPERKSCTVTNVIGPFECDRQIVCLITFQVLLFLSKCCLWALH